MYRSHDITLYLASDYMQIELYGFVQFTSRSILIEASLSVSDLSFLHSCVQLTKEESDTYCEIELSDCV